MRLKVSSMTDHTLSKLHADVLYQVKGPMEPYPMVYYDSDTNLEIRDLFDMILLTKSDPVYRMVENRYYYD